MKRDNLEILYGQNRKVIFKIPQGLTAALVLRWKNKETGSAIDLTGYTFLCQIRAGYADSSATIVRTIGETLNSDGDRIQATRSDGLIVIQLSAATTRSFKPEKSYYLELKLIAPDGTVPRRISATLEIIAEVARV